MYSIWGWLRSYTEEVVEGASEAASPYTMCSAPSDFCREPGQPWYADWPSLCVPVLGSLFRLFFTGLVVT